MWLTGHEIKTFCHSVVKPLGVDKHQHINIVTGTMLLMLATEWKCSVSVAVLNNSQSCSHGRKHFSLVFSWPESQISSKDYTELTINRWKKSKESQTETARCICRFWVKTHHVLCVTSMPYWHSSSSAFPWLWPDTVHQHISSNNNNINNSNKLWGW